MTSQALSILSEAMIASNFTHPAMFSGDFEILEQSVAVPNRPGWFSNRSWLHLGGTTGTNEGYAEVTLMGYPTTTNTLEGGSPPGSPKPNKDLRECLHRGTGSGRSLASHRRLGQKPVPPSTWAGLLAHVTNSRAKKGDPLLVKGSNPLQI
ncbi:hypothetical protein MJO28_000425 [Puccinia striiformis f. sp. tritici]|uniref:Uncharacterized protein n=2 Tax=Puccinia striiformis TaxID=27350 RepID=A0A2S4VZH3_9BASI|nr:hypothetical protein MJO28_000425 [Puccinia striiformis f. sp. tritici]POW14920.1 hypothetical protein PSTT_02563 [Puccinia striiformis]